MMNEEQKETVITAVEVETAEQMLKKNAWQKIGEQFAYYGLISLIFGIFYSFCLYKNSCGITFPLLILVGYELALFVLKRMGIPVKPGSYFLIGISILLGIATCRTYSGFLIFFNYLAVILLVCVFWIHQFYDERMWNIGKYMCSIFRFMVQTVGAVFLPFQHFIKYVKGLKNNRSKKIVFILIGVVAAVPLVGIIMLLLSAADMVFEEIVSQFMSSVLKPQTLIGVTFKGLVGTIGAYCLICAAGGRGISEKLKDRRKKEPIIAITAMSLVGLVYMLFCGIQILYLFMGKGTLPEDVTYSEYARQGFFQLVFVALLNLVMVLLCLKYFRKSQVLNMVLVIISLCTYVMIASAGYRMLLYIGEYHLTLLRVLVLWFLGVLSILMAGVLIIIFRNDFPLFRYCLVIISFSYLLLAWIRPDRVIAEYNVKYISEWNRMDFRYMRYNLSADAIPIVVEALKEEEDFCSKYDFSIPKYYDETIRGDREDYSIRKYNFSYEEALKAFKESGIDVDSPTRRKLTFSYLSDTLKENYSRAVYETNAVSAESIEEL